VHRRVLVELQDLQPALEEGEVVRLDTCCQDDGEGGNLVAGCDEM
jgi:hypothetical protein